MDRKMEVIQQVQLHNRFDIEVIDARTGKIKQRAQAENIILNGMWAQLVKTGTGGWFSNIALGTGTGTLSASRTALFTYLTDKAGANELITNNLKASGWASRRLDITLSETENVGSVLSEVGIGGATVYTHALLKDMNGNTTTITKTALDIIKVYATVYARFDQSGFYSGALRILSSALRASGGGIVQAMLGKTNPWSTTYASYCRLVMGGGKSPAAPGTYIFSGETLGTMYDYGSRVSLAATITRDSANKRVSFYARAAVGDCNSAYGIGGVCLLLSDSSYEGFLAAWIGLPFSGYTGSAITGETIGTGTGSQTNFKTAFPLVQSGAKIYVDGVEQTSGVTVQTKKPHQTNITYLMRTLRWDTSETALGRTAWGGVGGAVGSNYAANECVFENPYYETVAIQSLLLANGSRLYWSDNLTDWTLSATSSSDSVRTSIPSGDQNKRYWKTVGRASDLMGGGVRDFYNADYNSYNNIVFDTAPANGAVITADYTTDVCAKDANHVFDFTFTFQFGEYTP